MKKKKLTVGKLVVGTLSAADKAKILGGVAALVGSDFMSGCPVTVPPTYPGQSGFLSCA